MGKLDGKNVIITGAAGGMGRVACQVFCAEGAHVLGGDLDATAGKELEGELAGKKFTFTQVDLASSDSIRAFIGTASRHFPYVDVLYNTAGITLGKPILETEEDEWDRIERVNSRSLFLLTKGIAPMMSGRRGSIINVSSIGGVVAFDNMAAYGASKAAAAHFSKCAAAELAPGIRVNAICPGVVDTAMPRNFVKELANKDEIFDAWNREHLVGRLGRPEEVVSLLFQPGYFSSSQSRSSAETPASGFHHTVGR